MSYKLCKQIDGSKQELPESYFNGLVYAFPEENQEDYACVWKEDGDDDLTIEFFKEDNEIEMNNNNLVFMHYLNTMSNSGVFMYANLLLYFKEHPKHILFLTKKDNCLYVTDVFKREYNWAMGEHIECVHYERYYRYLSEFNIPYVAPFAIRCYDRPVYLDKCHTNTYLLKRYDYRAENSGIIWYRGKKEGN